MLGKTGNLKLTQQLLGHADIKSTLRYAHALEADYRHSRSRRRPVVLGREGRWRPPARTSATRSPLSASTAASGLVMSSVSEAASMWAGWVAILGLHPLQLGTIAVFGVGESTGIGVVACGWRLSWLEANDPEPRLLGCRLSFEEGTIEGRRLFRLEGRVAPSPFIGQSHGLVPSRMPHEPGLYPRHR